jgi:hypothetical protein
MSFEHIDQKIFDDIFRRTAVRAMVTLRSSKTKGANFDPSRNTGYDHTNQNPFAVNVITRTVTAGSLMYNQIGLVKAGAIQIICSNNDVSLIENSEVITINDVNYYTRDDAVGNKFLIFPTQFAKYSKIIIFRKEVGEIG